MRCQIEETAAGTRLDKYLATRFGQMGLRGWRRAIELGTALVNGRKARPGLRLQGCEELEILAEREEAPLKAKLLDCKDDYLFFHKPAGLHSAALAGNPQDSLEAQSTRLCAEQGLSGDITLLQRLDYGTEGIVCAARSAGAASAYRLHERAGKCVKSYLALLEGILEKPAMAKNKLETNGGKRIRIKAEPDDNPALWTAFEPVWSGAHPVRGCEVTLARCRLCAGQRHQVRAHAAALGLPLAGDWLYGSRRDGGFALAHYRIEFPGCLFEYLSPQSPFASLGCEPDANGVLKCI